MLKFLPHIIILFLVACSTEKSTSSRQEYLRWVGDIEYTPEFDKPDFELCHGDSSVNQYFNFGQGLQYEGEKRAILEKFENEYRPVKSGESGLVRIRFIVNCKGETDRFRIIAMDNEYKEKEFDSRITNQLLHLTKQLNGWRILPNIQEARDYYQYLIFKIENGNIVEILP
ncbi:MAG: hypothetical protein KI790_13115 [Cyclobacteriaceae bacterium]|nr:hypothetical protein [Cyclobacteriaceae bacterium HetDA_MAG_MS6]